MAGALNGIRRAGGAIWASARRGCNPDWYAWTTGDPWRRGLWSIEHFADILYQQDVTAFIDDALEQLAERILPQLEALEQELRARVKADLEEKKLGMEQRLTARHAKLREKEQEVLAALREKGRVLRSAAELRERIAALQSGQGRGELRLMRAFPRLHSKVYDSHLSKLRARLEKAGKRK